MPVEIWYIVVLLVTICVTFFVCKRPIYECMFFGYVLMLIFTGEYRNFWTYIEKTSKDTLFYAIIAFTALAKVLEATGAIDSVVNVIISLLGRFKGGAVYAAVAGSTFMGALSGSGAGNVAATGVFTIPAMKRSGVPAYLAANIESACSTLGNMIPPAGVILTALACYNDFSGADMSQSRFWLVCWGVALWFILQRILTVYLFCRYHKVQPMDRKEIPELGKTLKAGWKNLLLPLIILLPFLADYFFKATFLTARLGAGAGKMSSSLLIFTPGLAAAYALFVNRRKHSDSERADEALKFVNGIVPIGATVFFAYCIGNLFSATNVGAEVGKFIESLRLPVVAIAFMIPLVTAILGMILPGSAQIRIFGSTIISVFAAAGGNPLLAAVMLPAITGAMEGMTPPLALCMYTAMGIAGSNIKETTQNCLIWVGLHYLLSVICLLGILPIMGI